MAPINKQFDTKLRLVVRSDTQLIEHFKQGQGRALQDVEALDSLNFTEPVLAKPIKESCLM